MEERGRVSSKSTAIAIAGWWVLSLVAGLAGCATTASGPTVTSSASASSARAPLSEPDATRLQVFGYKAKAYLEENNPKMALGSAQKALTLAPDHIEMMLIAASAYEQLGQPSQALITLQKAQKLRPGAGEILNRSGLVLLQLNRYAEAATAIEQAMQDQEFAKLADGYFALGLLGRDTGESRKMLDNFTRALQINPGYYRVHIELAKFYHGMGNYALERQHLQDALQFNPGSQAILNRLVNSHLMEGDIARAVPLLKNIIAINPDSELGKQAAIKLKQLPVKQ